MENNHPFTIPGPLKSFLGGGFGGLMLVAVGQPFDIVKLRMVNNPEASIRQIVKETASEGMRTFYRGSLTPLLFTSSRNALLWFSYSMSYRNIFGVERADDLSLLNVFICGNIGGFFNALIEGPNDLAKTRVQTMKKVNGVYPFTGSVDALRKIFSQYGIRGVYQAHSATLFRNMPANGIYFVTFQGLKRWILATLDRDELTTYEAFICGGIAGTAYWLCYPVDFMKSTMQSQPSEYSQRKYRSYVHAVSSIYKQKGIRAFFKGFLPCIARSFPANGACFAGIELSRRYLERF